MAHYLDFERVLLQEVENKLVHVVTANLCKLFILENCLFLEDTGTAAVPG